MGSRVQGLGCRVIGFRCQGLGFGCQGLRFRVWTCMVPAKGLYEVHVMYGLGECTEGSCRVSVAASIGCSFLCRDCRRIREKDSTWASIRFRQGGALT